MQGMVRQGLREIGAFLFKGGLMDEGAFDDVAKGVKIWVAYESDGCEASWAIGHFLSRESAVKCCEDAYLAKQVEMLEDYGPDSEYVKRRKGRDASHMLWPNPLKWKDGALSQDGSKFSPHFAVGDEPIEVLP